MSTTPATSTSDDYETLKDDYDPAGRGRPPRHRGRDRRSLRPDAVERRADGGDRGGRRRPWRSWPGSWWPRAAGRARCRADDRHRRASARLAQQQPCSTKPASCLASGDAVEAVRLYDEVLAMQPENVEALTYRGWLLSSCVSSELHGEAQTLVARRGRQLDASYPDVHAFLASASCSAPTVTSRARWRSCDASTRSTRRRLRSPASATGRRRRSPSRPRQYEPGGAAGCFDRRMTVGSAAVRASTATVTIRSPTCSTPASTTSSARRWPS